MTLDRYALLSGTYYYYYYWRKTLQDQILSVVKAGFGGVDRQTEGFVNPLLNLLGLGFSQSETYSSVRTYAP